MLLTLQLKLDEAAAVEEVEARMAEAAAGPGRTTSTLQLEVLAAQALEDEAAVAQECTAATLLELCSRGWQRRWARRRGGQRPATACSGA